MGMKRVLVFGGHGRLGKRIVQVFSNDWEVVAPKHFEMPVESPHVWKFVETIAPHLVINCAAMNGMEACHKDPEQAVAVNTMAVANLATVCQDLGIRFIHFSSDYAIDKIGVYGATKAAGESLALICSNSLVIRLMSIYDTDFAGSLGPVDQFNKGRGSINNPIKVLSQTTAPTFCGWIAEVTHALAKHGGEKGILHLAPSGRISKLLFGYRALELFCDETDCHIVEGNELALRRPDCSLFDLRQTEKILHMLGHILPTIEENLIQCHETWEHEIHAGTTRTSASRSA